jgi:exodeoxyribonuclease VII small subunit
LRGAPAVGGEITTMDEETNAPELTFQEGLDALEAIVSRLESGTLALEEALRAFEEGVSLVRRLNEKLNEAERRVELLTRSADGKLRLKVAKEEEG